MTTSFAISLIVAVLLSRIGITAFLLVHLPIILSAATAGVWLFYVQHQFEHPTWKHDRACSLHEAALHDSSHYDPRAPLRWSTRKYRRAPGASPVQPHSLLPAATRAARPSHTARHGPVDPARKP